jgi:hypothetical protein
MPSTNAVRQARWRAARRRIEVWLESQAVERLDRLVRILDASGRADVIMRLIAAEQRFGSAYRKLMRLAKQGELDRGALAQVLGPVVRALYVERKGAGRTGKQARARLDRLRRSAAIEGEDQNRPAAPVKL